MPEVLEGEAVEVGQELEPIAGAALFKTDDPVEVVAEATRVADALAAVIRAKQLFTKIQGRDHVRVEGWTLLGSMLGVTAVVTDTAEIADGYRATVEARAADGRVVGRADAVCTKAETRWNKADDYARLSMAQTRATSKALKGPLGFVVSLAGYQTTPAEEMTFAEPDAPQPVQQTESPKVAALTDALHKAKANRGQITVWLAEVTAEPWTTDNFMDGLRSLTDEQADTFLTLVNGAVDSK